MPIKITRATFHESRAALYNLMRRKHNFTLREYEEAEVVVLYLLRRNKDCTIWVSDNEGGTGIQFFFGGTAWLHLDDKKFWVVKLLHNNSKPNHFLDTKVIKYTDIFERF